MPTARCPALYPINVFVHIKKISDHVSDIFVFIIYMNKIDTFLSQMSISFVYAYSADEKWSRSILYIPLCAVVYPLMYLSCVFY